MKLPKQISPEGQRQLEEAWNREYDLGKGKPALDIDAYLLSHDCKGSRDMWLFPVPSGADKILSRAECFTACKMADMGLLLLSSEGDTEATEGLAFIIETYHKNKYRESETPANGEGK